MIKGSHHKPESNRKNAEAHRGNKASTETRKKMQKQNKQTQKSRTGKVKGGK